VPMKFSNFHDNFIVIPLLSKCPFTIEPNIHIQELKVTAMFLCRTVVQMKTVRLIGLPKT
jgi:hypothetical protein